MMGAVLSAGLGSRRNRNTTHPREQTVVKTAYIGILTSAVIEETSDSRKYVKRLPISELDEMQHEGGRLP